MAKSLARKIQPNRPPRVQIQYEIELDGAKKAIQLPFVLGVFAGLSGKPADVPPSVSDRRFLEIDRLNFDRRLAAIKARVAFQVPNQLAYEGTLNVELTFEHLDDFHPGAIARRVDPLRALFDTRVKLVALSTRADEGSDLEALLRRALREPEMMRQLAAVATTEDVAALVLKASKVQSADVRDMVLTEVNAFAAYALSQDNAIVERLAQGGVTAMIQQIDDDLSRQMKEILHHPEFQQLEGTWRGLHHLVSGTESDELLKIRVFNISKTELARTLKKFRGTAWDQSPIFKQVVETEFGQFGGEPFACLLGDYYFDHTPADMEVVREMAHIADAAHAPFIAGASPTLLQMESWQELANPRDLNKIHMTPEYVAWHAFRESDDARYVGLTMPRYLARLPYGSTTNPVEEFSFEEHTEMADHSQFTWANCVYAWGVNVGRAFKLYGWCAQIRGVETGGIVEGLPVHAFGADDGDLLTKCPTEIGITDRRATELEQLGLLALVHRKYSSFAVFTNGRSVQKPREFADPDAKADASLMATLPYTLAAGRFAHYIRCIVRDKIGSQTDRYDVQDLLHNWLAIYVDDDPAHSPESVKARAPLASGEVVVEDIEGRPQVYSATISLKPHYQLEPLTQSMRLVAWLPASTNAR